MPSLLRKIELPAEGPERKELLARQWLVTNGLGGYASGTLAGGCTWRYHGLLIAALPAPYGRIMMLNHLEEHLCLPGGKRLRIDGPGCDTEIPGLSLREFLLENQIPHWRYEAGDLRLEKRLVMPKLQNTVHLTYRLPQAIGGAWLELRPALQFRPFEGSVNTAITPDGYEVRCHGRRIEIAAPNGLPALRLWADAPSACFVAEGGACREVMYAREADRGYESRGQLWSPGYFSVPLEAGSATLIASTEDWRSMLALSPEEAVAMEHLRVHRLRHKVTRADEEGPVAHLTIAADQFIITPRGRIRDAARARAMGNELRSVIAGYHWFTDWGRDTMISLEGLALATGRFPEAAWILHTFAGAVQDGLIPNFFPESDTKGIYHTADASLWFFHAVQRYVAITRDREILVTLLPVLRDIIHHHFRGTRFGIGVDTSDGLLRQGEEGYQLTWMDAKVGDWVVTPRRGKAVEINALWYNALRVLENFERESGDAAAAAELAGAAQQVAESFNRRFWQAESACLYDVIDGPAGNDAAIRPNQLLAISLPHPVLDSRHWASVVELVEKELLTPVGLRTLSPRHPDYKQRYSGDLRSRDAAYHQGTVWPWLMGPFIDAWLKVHPGRQREARRFLDGLINHLDDAGIGSISEIFDAEPPYAPRGCIAQAWSVAEVLRTWLLTDDARNAPEPGAPSSSPQSTR